MIWELENSEDILNRQKYADRIKTEFIPKIEQSIKKLSKSEEKTKPESIPQESWDIYIKAIKEINEFELSIEKRFLKELKNRLADYDVYNQKME